MNSFSILNSLPLLCLVLATTWTSCMLIREANADNIINSNNTKWSKITVAEYDAKEYSFLHDINMKRVAKGESQLKPSRLLTNYAQREANRMAKLSGLVYPQIDFLDQHFGYAIKISGQNGRLLGNEYKSYIFIVKQGVLENFCFLSRSKDLLRQLVHASRHQHTRSQLQLQLETTRSRVGLRGRLRTNGRCVQSNFHSEIVSNESN